MITFLHGIVEEKEPTRVVINVGGIGYEAFIPLSSYDQMPSRGSACRLLTVDHVREDLHQLFGFMSEDERSMFQQLTTVSGVGPRTALSSLSGLSVRELRAAIANRDIRRLSSIQGIGKKTAERIVVELKDKISPADALEALADSESGRPEEDMKTRDAILALVALGYRQDEGRKMVRQALEHGDAADSTEDIIRKALAGR
jgi:holliday junction DNA helicase RuvA